MKMDNFDYNRTRERNKLKKQIPIGGGAFYEWYEGGHYFKVVMEGNGKNMTMSSQRIDRETFNN